MASKEILYVTTVDVTIAAFLIPHIKVLQQRGYDVEAACHLGSRAPAIQASGISAHNIPFERSYTSLNNVVVFFKLIKLIRIRKYGLVHVHTPAAAFLGRLAAKLARGKNVKTLYTAHGFHFLKGGNKFKNLLFLTLERIASQWTDALIVMNEEDYEAAKRYRLAPEGNLFFVKGIGVDTTRFRPDLLTPGKKDSLKQQLNCSSDKVIGMVGEFNPEKRHIDLLDAAGKVIKEYEGVSFVFIGDGPLLPKLQKLANSRWYKDKIKFLGYRSDIPQFLNVIDILVLPSVREGLSRTIQEAMASGKPVIATGVRGNRDLVRHEETGLLVPPKDSEALARAILKLLQDEELAERMGRKAREIAVTELSLDKIVEQTVAIQEELLDTVGQMCSGT